MKLHLLAACLAAGASGSSASAGAFVPAGNQKTALRPYRTAASVSARGTTSTTISSSSAADPRVKKLLVQAEAGSDARIDERSDAELNARREAARQARRLGQLASPGLGSAGGVGPRNAGGPPRSALALIAPTNDDCSAATPIAGAGPFAFDTTGATTSPEQGGCGTDATLDIWYSWMAPSTGSVVMSLCAGPAAFDSVIKVYDGASCPVGAALACNDEFCAHLSQLTFTATIGNTYMLQVGGWTGDFGPGSFTLAAPPPPPPPPVDDDCASATVLAGLGVFPFDNTGATTGAEGQSEPLCNIYGDTGILSDIWFTWVAPASGQALFTGCGLGAIDTKVAVYLGSGCPTGPALGCDDDFCGFPLTSQVSWTCTAGLTYTIQVGLYPLGGALPGAGSFALDVLSLPAGCEPLDDGTAENIWSLGGNSDTVWLVRFGEPGITTTIDSVDVLYGSPFFPTASPGNGTPTDILLYADGPSQDGDPTDATLLAQVPSMVSMLATDTYVNTPLSAPVTITGYFFAGAHEFAPTGTFVAPNDEGSLWTGRSWEFGNNTGGVANLADPGSSAYPPTQLNGFVGGVGNFCVRVNCSFGPTNTFCQPGFATTITCPCSNPPSGLARGCDNKDATGGAQLTASGNPSLSAPLATTLILTDSFQNNLGSQVSILLQGKVLTNGATFGHGLKCFGTFLRIYNKTAVLGTISFPIGADLTIPARSAAAGQPIPPGAPRFYQVYYRDNVNMLPAATCSTSASKQNISDGQMCYWVP